LTGVVLETPRLTEPDGRAYRPLSEVLDRRTFAAAGTGWNCAAGVRVTTSTPLVKR